MKHTIELMASTERIINEGLRVALRERDAIRGLELFLKHIGRCSKCERIYIFEGKRGENVFNTFEWCAEGVSSEKNNLQDVPFEAVEWWYHAFADGHCIVIKDVESIRETEPLTYAYLKPQNIRSLVASPLVLEGEIIGFYGVDNPQEGDMNHIADIAEIIGHFIVSLLEKQKLIMQLERLSFEDSLSNVRNRHALHYDLSRTKSMKNTGVIYCDVLGLKKVNDTLGHQAGDELIVRASKTLQSAFRRTDIYRMGGDEFLVLCNELDEDLFWQRVEFLRKGMRENAAMMSLGCLWRAEVSDVEAVIRETDQLMYEEKRAYYAALEADKNR